MLYVVGNMITYDHRPFARGNHGFLSNDIHCKIIIFLSIMGTIMNIDSFTGLQKILLRICNSIFN